MDWTTGISLGCVLWGAAMAGHDADLDPSRAILFATFAEGEDELHNVLLTAESLRTFGGALRGCEFWLYVPTGFLEEAAQQVDQRPQLHVRVSASEAPAEATWFYYARKVFAAARAERELLARSAESHRPDNARSAPILAWLGPDTIFLDEPRDFLLAPPKRLGYRPVMHKNVGRLWSEAPDEFWARALERMAVPKEKLFPVVTIADGDSIYPYFNAGCLVVRPEEGMLRRWPEYFEKLYRDPQLRRMCEQQVGRRVFLHQVALTGAILNHLEPDELAEFPESINYPIFFEQTFGAKRVFHDLREVVTFRHESYFQDPAPDWERRLLGPREKISWIKTHLVGR